MPALISMAIPKPVAHWRIREGVFSAFGISSKRSRYLNPGHHPRHYAVSRYLGQSRYGGRVSTTHHKDPRTKGSLGPGEKHITNAPKVHLSPEREKIFKRLSGGKTLPRDNSTRWTSGYKLVTYLTESLVETGVKLMYEQYPEIVDVKG